MLSTENILLAIATISIVTSLPLEARAEAETGSASPSAMVDIETPPMPTFFRLTTDRWFIEITDGQGVNAAVLTTVRLFQPARDIQRLGSFVFVLNEWDGVTVLDLRNPAQPTRQFLGEGWVERMELREKSMLVLTLASGAASMFDLSNPSQAKLLKTQETLKLDLPKSRTQLRSALGLRIGGGVLLGIGIVPTLFGIIFLARGAGESGEGRAVLLGMGGGVFGTSAGLFLVPGAIMAGVGFARSR